MQNAHNALDIESMQKKYPQENQKKFVIFLTLLCRFAFFRCTKYTTRPHHTMNE